MAILQPQTLVEQSVTKSDQVNKSSHAACHLGTDNPFGIVQVENGSVYVSEAVSR